jgi:hypothetical protein
MSASNQRNPTVLRRSSPPSVPTSVRTSRSPGTSTSSRTTSSLSAPASTGLFQNGRTDRPGVFAGTTATARRGVPSSSGKGKEAVSRSMDQARLQGFFEPVSQTLSPSTRALIAGLRMPCPVRPSANPEARSRLSLAMAASSIHSIPPLCAAVSTREATEKWCMVVATARDGEREPTARWTRTAVSRSAPLPPCSAGTRRPGPPAVRKWSSPGLPGVSQVDSGAAAKASSRPGRRSVRVARSCSRKCISASLTSSREDRRNVWSGRNRPRPCPAGCPQT